MNKAKKATQCFIGTNIKITKSLRESLIGLEGKVIDETKHTFNVKTLNGVKRLIKNQIVFMVNDNEENIVDGKEIIKRPEERLKTRIKNE